MADIIQVESVEAWISGHEVTKGGQETLADAWHGRIEIQPACSHAIETSIRFGQIEVRIIENRSAATIDEDGPGAEVLEQPGIAPRRQRKHVHPRMNSHAAGVGGLDKRSQHIRPTLVDTRPAFGKIGSWVEHASTPIDLYKEFSRAETSRSVEQWRNPRRVIEDPVAALSEDPQAANRGGRLLQLDGLEGFGGRDRGRGRILGGSPPSGKIVRRTSRQASRKNDAQSQGAPYVIGIESVESQNAHTVTSRALRLNGGHYKKGANLSLRIRRSVSSSAGFCAPMTPIESKRMTRS